MVTKFTEYQLEQAFEAVNPKHHERKFCAVFDDPGEDNLDCAVEAVLTFTELVPEVHRMPNGKVRFTAH